MIVEVLYYDVTTLYGDRGNITYLQRALPHASFVFTQYPQKPYFLKEAVDMVVMGSMSESWQRRIIELLYHYQTRLIDLISDDVVFLITGNALDLFGKSITYKDEMIPALDIFDFTTITKLKQRLNTKVLGQFEDMEIVGFKSQFAQAYGNNQENAFIHIKSGFGFNLDSFYEGIHYRNFFGTHLIGPFLILNPLFSRYLVQLVTKKQEVMPLFDELMQAYELRLKEFKDPKLG